MTGFSVSAAIRDGGSTEKGLRPHALHLVLPALASWATALILLGLPSPVGATVAAIAAVGALSAMAVVPSDGIAGWRNAVIGMLGCVAAVAGTVALQVHAISTGPVAEMAARGASATAEVVVTDDPRELPQHGGPYRQESFVVPARIEAIGAGSGRTTTRVPVVMLTSGDEWRSLLPSQRIAVQGRFGPADAGELVAAVMLVRGPPRVLGEPSWVQRTAATLRSGLREAAGVLPPLQRGLLPGLVVGDVSHLDRQVKADFKAAGLSHLTAVSGANLAIVAGAAVALARTAGLPLAARAVLAAFAMLAFAIVARPSPSVLRALLMGTVAAVALGTGRSRDGVAALSATVLGLILFDPALARSYGFALSVCATGGILVIAPRWRDRLERRMPRWAAEAIAVPAAAQAAVTPVLVLMSGQLAPVAIPANLLAGPAVAPATLLGSVAALVAPLHMGFAQVLVRPAGLATGWIIAVAERAAGLPLAVIPWPGGVIGLVILAVTAPIILLALRHRWLRRAVLAAAAGVVVAATVAVPIVARWPPRGWLLVACDVGQGDALLVAAGPGRAVVVDTGPDPVLMDRCLRSMGVSEVPLVVLTHPHFDHVGGLDGVFRDRRVGAVVVTPHRVAERESARLSNDLARRGVVEWGALPGASWRFGPSELTVVAPSAEAPPAGGGEGAVVNNASVVLYVRWAAGTALLSGDIETEAQAELLRRGLPPVDILKIPHHGSGGHDPGFFAAAGARAALISVGAGNDYGHPAPSTLARLNMLGVRVYRTDLSGDLAVVAREGGLAIIARGPAGR
ncbi:competence protein ComEC [Streptosporangium album]|uniref:Competence protein ComEC n=1 Tax=Streptosporangium album TaxID=47479 RepID=A0A7W7RZI7_9ACTN|nr:ComEC/Rec2 family competence protein [Streptosporangium album]MBB4940807.1 competence protein ComEC [Streptosporangium album]